jgi:hypothetical protein
MQRLELAGLRRSVLAALAVAFLIPVAVAVWAVLQLGGSKSNPPTAAAGSTGTARAASSHVPAHRAMPMTQSPAQSTLYKTVIGVNGSMFAQGMVPPSACKATSASMVACTQPVQAVNTVTFRAYPSLKALYSAYMGRAMALSGGQFHTNYGDCTEVLTSGERSWNHNVAHPLKYPFSMFPSGQITDDQAAGRLFCTFANGQLHLVWTQNDGGLLGELSGSPHYDAYVWWRQVHHEIALPGTPSMNKMQNSHMPSGQSSQSTSGMGT